MTGVDVSGEGTVDGSGDEWLHLGSPGRGAAPRGPRLGRPRLICFQNCKHVRITGLRLKQQPIWCLHILYSDDVTVDGLDIRADHNIPSSDGIDIGSSRTVRVRNVDIDVNDDCIFWPRIFGAN